MQLQSTPFVFNALLSVRDYSEVRPKTDLKAFFGGDATLYRLNEPVFFASEVLVKASVGQTLATYASGEGRHLSQFSGGPLLDVSVGDNRFILG